MAFDDRPILVKQIVTVAFNTISDMREVADNESLSDEEAEKRIFDEAAFRIEQLLTELGIDSSDYDDCFVDESEPTWTTEDERDD